MADNEEMLFGDSETDVTHFSETLGTTMSSFTPINHSSSRTVDPQQTLWDFELGDDSLYNLPDDNIPGDGAKKKRKGPETAKGRSVSFTPVWSYEDDGDKSTMNRADDGPPNKKRAALKSRSQSSNAQLIARPQGGQEEAQNTHSSTPTGSSRKTKNGSSCPKRKASSNPVFKNPVITKPSSSSHSKKITMDEPKLLGEEDPTIKYQGFMTTQESVQSSSSYLAQTTLEKLAAFRCRPSSTKTREAARSWWTSSGRPIHEGPPDNRESDMVMLHEPQTVSEDAVDISKRPHPEVERSDLDDTVLEIDPLPDLYNSDEFDEGLNDDDLLAIQSEPIRPETPLKLQEVEQNCRTVASQPHTERSHPSFIPVKNSGTKAVVPESPITWSLNLLSKPDDNDYPMDDAEEEDLLQFAAMRTAANDFERLAPPSSVQRAFDDEREVFDSTLQFSPPKHQENSTAGHTNPSANYSPMKHSEMELPAGREEDWSFISANHPSENDDLIIVEQLSTPRGHSVAIKPAKHAKPTHTLKKGIPENISSSPARNSVSMVSKALTSESKVTILAMDDSHEYEPLKPFIRPPFPSLIMDRCPINGLSAQSFLRTCFRIGEMYQAGTKYDTQKLDAVIELFARVNFSSREPGTTKQHFQFMDLWHDRAPYPNGVLDSYRATGLADSESKIFLSGQDKKMARVLGRLKRDTKNACWFLQITNIRPTDWEEIRWTKRIITGDDLAEKLRLS